MINGKDDLSRVNYRFQVIAVASANSQFPSGKLALSKFRPHLHTIPAHVSIYHFRQFSATRLRDASQRSGGICRWRFVDYAFPSRTHQVRLRCPRFRRGVCVCFLNNFHRQHSLNVPPPRFGPRNRPRNPRPRRVGSSYYFPPFRNLKNNRNEINAKLFQLFNPFDRSDLDTDLSTNLDVSPLLRLFVNELKRVCTCITGKVGTWKECGSNWLIQLISTGS